MKDKNFSLHRSKPTPTAGSEASKRVGGSSDVQYEKYPKPEPIKPPVKKD